MRKIVFLVFLAFTGYWIYGSALIVLEELSRPAILIVRYDNLYVLEKIRRGEQDIRDGRTCTTEEAKARMQKWLIP